MATSRGRHTRNVHPRIDGTGRDLSIDGMDHFVIRDREVMLQIFVVFDRMQFAQQLGVMPPDDSPRIAR